MKFHDMIWALSKRGPGFYIKLNICHTIITKLRTTKNLTRAMSLDEEAEFRNKQMIANTLRKIGNGWRTRAGLTDGV